MILIIWNSLELLIFISPTMIQLVNQFDTYNDKAGVATPSGWKCCCCCCCCCVITASTAIWIQWRYLQSLQKDFEIKINNTKDNPIEREQLEILVSSTLAKPKPWFFKIMLWGTIIFQLIVGLYFIWLYYRSSFDHTVHLLGILIHIGIFGIFGYMIYNILIFIRVRMIVDTQVKQYSYKELTLLRKFWYLCALWGCAIIEIIILLWITSLNWFL